jgi:multiple RNA-binding domain-containing protein 1
LERVILPPTKTMALAVYLEAAEARVAFKGLAYKRYKVQTRGIFFSK